MARGQKLERQNFERVRGNSVVGELLAGSWQGNDDRPYREAIEVAIFQVIY